MTGSTGLHQVYQGYERRAKESHRDTVTYEIEMLRFCLAKVVGTEGGKRYLHDLFLEGYLLHYRNLIRFFSGKHHRADDLSMHDPREWADREVTEDEIREIKSPALALDDKHYNDISKYLQHCTRLRFERRKIWDVLEMHRELDVVITRFEHVFPS